MTFMDAAADLEEMKRNVAGRLHRRYPLVDQAEIDAMVAEEAAADAERTPGSPDR